MSKFIFLKSLRELLIPLKRLIDKKAENVNWNENDSTASGYIANRPFYSYKKLEKGKQFIQETIFTGTDNNGTISAPIEFDFSLFPSENALLSTTLEIVFDNELFERKFTFYDFIDFPIIGNPKFLTEDENVDNGDPFCLVPLGYIHIGDTEEHIISAKTPDIFVEKHKKIDTKYLPDMPEFAEVAYSGYYSDLQGLPTIYTDVIRYSQKQDLSFEQKLIAKENIGLDTIDYSRLQNIPVSNFSHEERTFNNILYNQLDFDSSIIFENIDYKCSYTVKFSQDSYKQGATETDSNSVLEFETDDNGYKTYKTYYFTLKVDTNNHSLGITQWTAIIDQVSITIEDLKIEKISQLNEQFIPDTIARTTDIPDIPEVTTSDNGKLLGVVEGSIGLIEGIATETYVDTQINNLSTVAATGSWNDLEDKPFEDYTASVSNTLNFTDIDTFQISSGITVYRKASQINPFLNFDLNQNANYEFFVKKIDGSIIHGRGLCQPFIYNEHLAIGNKELLEEQPNVFNHYDFFYGYINNGYYLIVSQEREYTEALVSISTSDIKTLEEKFIPVEIARQTEIENTNLQLDEIKNSLSIIAISGSWNDLNDKPFGEEQSFTLLSEGNVVTEENNAEVTVDIDSDYLSSSTEEYYYIQWNDTLYKTVYNSFYYGIGNAYLIDSAEQNTGEPFFIYQALSPRYTDFIIEEAGSYNFKVYTGQINIKTLDEQFIPDIIARTEDIPSTAGLASEEYVNTQIANQSSEIWTFTLADGSVVTKTVVVK